MSKTKAEPKPVPQPQPKPPVTVNDVDSSSCKTCGSTERSAYRGTTSQPGSGEIEGRPFNLVVWRYCTCLKCGQVRCDRSFEMVTQPPESAPAPENSDV